jgi:hypothetical protein
MENSLTDRVLLVDLENVQKVDLSQIPVDAHVMIFYGVTQKKRKREAVTHGFEVAVGQSYVTVGNLHAHPASVSSPLAVRRALSATVGA